MSSLKPVVRLPRNGAPAAHGAFPTEIAAAEQTEQRGRGVGDSAEKLARSGRLDREGEGGGKLEAVFLSEFEARAPFVEFTLSEDAVKVASSPNAGGASVISESLSVEYFVRHFGASDIISEMEVQYCDSNWKKVDYICSLFGQRFGVSVTRAMMYPDPGRFDYHHAKALLRKKLHGLVVAWPSHLCAESLAFKRTYSSF
ncbi:unnamed protein product [Closterium sp. Naga37s-1]|nr:unnamed protein product [Closterium sp. Naga37s-1]